MRTDSLIRGMAFLSFLVLLIIFGGTATAQEDTSMPVEATDATFDEEVNMSEVPVIVEFYSPRCAHCRNMESLVNSLAGELAGQAKVVKVNVMSNAISPSRYGVHGVPAFYLIRDGEVITSAVGAMSEEDLRSRLGIGVHAQP